MGSWLNRATIYQVLVDRFAADGDMLPDRGENEFLGGSINGIRSRLSHMQAMGITCLWLSPFYQTLQYHGYHITNFEKVDPHFGSLADLRELVDDCHALGMRIIADWVPNHCSTEHPFFQEALSNRNSPYRSWFYFNDRTNGYRSFLHYPELAKFNLNNNADARNYMLNNARFWLSFGFDGFRIDHAIGPGMGFWRALRRLVDREFPEAVLLGEVWGAGIVPSDFITLGILHKQRRQRWGINQQELQLDYQDVFHGVLDFHFAHMLRTHFSKKSKAGVELRNASLDHFSLGYTSAFLPILFLDNHDLDRFLFVCGNRKSRLHSALSFLFSFPCPKVIYYGTEALMGQERSIHLPIPNADLQARRPMPWKSVDASTVNLIQRLSSSF